MSNFSVGFGGPVAQAHGFGFGFYFGSMSGFGFGFGLLESLIAQHLIMTRRRRRTVESHRSIDLGPPVAHRKPIEGLIAQHLVLEPGRELLAPP